MEYSEDDLSLCERDDLQCALCLFPLVEPVLHIKCRVMFCALCVQKLKSCPICTEPLASALSSIIPRAVTNRLNALTVRCLNCSAKMERGSHSRHLEVCPIGMND